MENYSASFRLKHHTNLCFYANTHSQYEIVSVSEGCLTISAGRQDISLTEGQAIFLPPYCVHSFESVQNSVCHIWEFSPNLIPEKLPDDIVLFNLCPNTEEFFYKTENTDSVFAHKAAIYYIISQMKETAKAEKYYHPAEDICTGAVKYIAENFTSAVTLYSAAEHLCVNYSYLSRVFKQKHGISFTECLNGTRINCAITLLCTGNMTVTDIALSCGFGSVRNFNRIFTAKTGHSPLEFRKNQHVFLQ